MRFNFLATGALASAMLLGCTSTPLVDVPGPDEPGPARTPTRAAIAMRFDAWTPPPPDEEDLVPDYRELGIAPDALVLFFADEPESCAQPFRAPEPLESRDCADDPASHTTFIIPPELDHDGWVDLRDPRILGSTFTWGRGCAFSGAVSSGWLGAVDLGKRGSDTIDVNLEDQPQPATITGDYDARFCGPPLPAAAATPALAVPGADPGSLELILGTAADTCDDFDATIACSHTWRARIALPAGAPQDEAIDLASVDARIEASRDDAVSCTENDRVHGRLSTGTVEVVAADAESVTVRVFDSYAAALGYSADGTYRAIRCP
jgi:hypothetical protein